MKKIYLLLLCVIFILFGSSCASNIAKNDVEILAGYPKESPFSETPTRVLYVDSGILYYYNKLDGENYVFCFDPICRHNDFRECIALKFQMSDSYQPIKYCAENNRFYALRSEQLYSFSFDGSDLQLEFSFGEHGGMDEIIYMPYGVRNLNIVGKYVFCLIPDADTGITCLMRYDVETESMEVAYQDTENNISDYLCVGNVVYMALTGTEPGLYCADLEFAVVEQVSKNIIDFSNGVYWNDKIYYLQTKMLINEDQSMKPISEKLICYSFETNAFADVLTIDDSTRYNLLSVTDEYIYFTKQEEQYFGYHVHQFGSDKDYNNYSRIYRYDMSTEQMEVVLDDLSCETKQIYFVDDRVLIMGNQCIISEGNAKKTAGAFCADIDEYGNFVNLVHIKSN